MINEDYLKGLNDAIAATCYGCKAEWPFNKKQPELHDDPNSPKYCICGSERIRRLRDEYIHQQQDQF